MASQFGDLEAIRDQLGALLAELTLAAGDVADAPAEDDAGTLVAAFGQLFEVMQRLENDQGRPKVIEREPETETGDRVAVSEVGEYAIALVDKTARLLQPSDSVRVEQLSELILEFAGWTVKFGGEIRALEPVVDNLAAVANRSADTSRLASLAELALNVAGAASAEYRQDLEQSNPGRPWRVLHINMGIVATRSRRPDLMEESFGRLTELFPGDAAVFFQQGVQQLQLSDYPEAVRAVMTKYFEQWSTKPALH